MRMTLTTVLLALATAVFGQDEPSLKLFDVGLRLSAINLSFQLPNEIKHTPIYPGDLQPGQYGVVGNNEPEGMIESLDVVAGVRPIPVRWLNGLMFGYALRYMLYENPRDYRSGMIASQPYVEPQRWAYTYTRVSDIEDFGHEVFASFDVPLTSEVAVSAGCRYLFPLGVEFEQGWDRFAMDWTYRKTGADMSGWVPFAGVTYAIDKEGWFGVSFSRGHYRLEFPNNIGDGRADTWSIEFSGGWRF
jgi:hypothetical protein